MEVVGVLQTTTVANRKALSGQQKAQIQIQIQDTLFNSPIVISYGATG